MPPIMLLVNAAPARGGTVGGIGLFLAGDAL